MRTILATVLAVIVVGSAAEITATTFGQRVIIHDGDGNLIVDAVCLSGPATVYDKTGQVLFELAVGEDYPTGCSHR